MPGKSELEQIFKQTARRARDGLFADILAAVEEVAGIPELMKEGRPDWPNALSLVIQLARGTPDVEGAALKRKVRAAVGKRLGVTGDELKERLGAWLEATKAELTGELPEPLRPLVAPLSELHEAYRWPVEISKGTRVDLADGLPFDIDAAAGASLAVESLAPAALSPPLDSMPGDADRVLRFMLSGSYRVGAAADGLAGLFSVTAGASRAGSLQYRYLYARRSDDLLVAALAGTVRSVPSPFSLSQIGAAGERHLSELRFTAHGKVGAEVSITASHAFAGVLGKVGAEELPLAGTAALAFSGHYRREGDFFLRAVPDDDGWVTVSIRQLDAAEGSARLGFEAGVTLRNIDGALLPLLEKHLPGSEAVSELLGELSAPGAWVRETLSEKLKLSDALAERAKEALLSDRRLVSRVVGEALEAAVDLGGLDVTGQAEAEAKKVLDRLRTQLPLSPDLSSDIAAELSDAVVGAIRKYVGGLEGAVKARGRETLDRLRGALKVLDAPEQTLDAFLAGADEKAVELLAPVKKLVARYEALRSRLMGAISDNATASLGLELIRSWKSLNSEGAELEARLNPGEPLARRIHRQMMFGDLTGLIRALREKPAKLEQAVELKSGLLSRTLSEESSLAVNIGVLDKALSLESFARSGVRVIRDLGGRVMMVSGETEIGKAAKWRQEEQRVGFVNELALAARAAEPGKRLLNMARVNLGYSDEDMARDELDAYLDSVLDAGLIAPAEAEALSSRYDALAGRADGKVRAVIELTMALPPAIFVAAAKKEDAEIRRIALRAIWDLQPRNRGTERMMDLARSLGPTGDGPANLLQVPGIERATPKIADAIVRRFEKSTGLKLPRSRVRPRSDTDRLAHMVTLAKKFADGLRGLSTLTGLDPAADGFADKANDLQKEIADDLDAWLAASVIALVFDGGIPRRNLAFVGALANLAGMEQPLIGAIRTP